MKYILVFVYACIYVFGCVCIYLTMYSTLTFLYPTKPNPRLLTNQRLRPLPATRKLQNIALQTGVFVVYVKTRFYNYSNKNSFCLLLKITIFAEFSSNNWIPWITGKLCHHDFWDDKYIIFKSKVCINLFVLPH